jgi:hypothetical protein
MFYLWNLSHVLSVWVIRGLGLLLNIREDLRLDCRCARGSRVGLDGIEAQQSGAAYTEHSWASSRRCSICSSRGASRSRCCIGLLTALKSWVGRQEE